MNNVLYPWLIEAGFLTWRTVTRGRPQQAGGGKIPWPADYVSTFVVFGALGVIADSSPGASRAATLAGWGFVIATVLNLFDPTSLAKAQATQAAQVPNQVPQQQGAA